MYRGPRPVDSRRALDHMGRSEVMPNLCDCKVTIRSQNVDTILAVAQVAKKHGPLSPHKVPLRDRLRKRLHLVLAEMGFRARVKPITGPFLLDFLSPMPEDLKVRAERREGLSEAFANIRKKAEQDPGISEEAATAELPDWWEWLMENWGCQDELFEIDLEASSPGELTLRFATVASAPIAAFRAGSTRLGFSFRLTYHDGPSVGWATGDEHQDFDFHWELPPASQGIPQDIIDDFELDDVHHRYKEGTL